VIASILQEVKEAMYRLTVADLDSPSYFVATAAVALGFFEREGLDVEIVFNSENGPEELRDGQIHFFGGPAYAALRAFPQWQGAKLLCALSQYSYWFMGVRADLDIQRGDVSAVKGLRISSSLSWPGMGLRHMLAESGIDIARDNVRIVASPPPTGDKGWLGRNGVIAIESGMADAFWGNGMRVALGESVGVAKLHLDLRRGDGPPGARFYSFPALTTTERLVRERPEHAAKAIRAIVKTQKALRADPSLATQVGERLFPPDEAKLIARLIERDAPFYDAKISHEAVNGLNKFTSAIGLIVQPVEYADLVTTPFGHIWNE
jgi:ABC-type nitrate/sulfonate/bicarbonate transport system substrate-binding protein